MSDIGDWFRSIPLITRSWFAASIAVPFIGKLGLVDFRHLMLVPELVYSKFHVSASWLYSPECVEVNSAAFVFRMYIG